MRTSVVDVRVTLPRASFSRPTLIGVILALTWYTVVFVVCAVTWAVRLGIVLVLRARDYAKRR